MTTDFEHDLREALRDEAARAPRPADDWTPALPITGHSPERSRWVLITAACLIVVAGVAGLIVTQRPSTSAPVSVSSTTTDTATVPSELETPTTHASVVPPGSTSPVLTTVGSPPLVSRAGIAIGDSRMLGAAPDLDRLGFTIDALESRQFADVVGIVQRLSDNGQLPDVMVIDLGNNGVIQQPDLDTMMEQVREVPTVVLLTSPVERDWVQTNNALITGLPAVYSNVTVIDFATKAAECPGDCFYADNLHLKTDGQLFYSNLIAEAVGLNPLQPGPDADVPVTYEAITFTQSFTPECANPLPAGGWDTMDILAIADEAGTAWRNDFTYPDGTTRSLIAFDDPWNPTRLETSGEWAGATLGCSLDDGSHVIMTAEPGQGSFYSLNPLAPVPPPVELSPPGREVPSVITYRDLAEQQPGAHSDSTGRFAGLWSQQIDGFGGINNQSPLTQTQEWFVDPTTGDVLEQRYTQHVDGVGTAEWTATMIQAGTSRVTPSSMTDPNTRTRFE